jgi:hypothetical protein
VITARAFSGQKYAVLGLARSGRATVEALLASGAQVVAWDEKEEARAALVPLPFRGEDGSRSEPGEGKSGELQTPPLPTSLRSATLSPEGERGLTFADPLTIDLTGFAGVVVSPGVPLNRHPIAAHARSAGVPVIGDIELFAQARPELPPHKELGPTWPGGVEVSFGQWQKLALARGFMRDRPLVLVLDEPTAALDAETEHALFARYAAAARAGGGGRITVLVSHRFSTVRMADLIVVLDGARVVEVGSHDELMARHGQYAELYAIQAAAYQ